MRFVRFEDALWTSGGYDVNKLPNVAINFISNGHFFFANTHKEYRNYLVICYYLPQIFSGASNSNNMGCDKNISRDLRHRFRISTSLSCTFFPGLAPRTKKSMRNTFENFINLFNLFFYLFVCLLVGLFSINQKAFKTFASLFLPYLSVHTA